MKIVEGSYLDYIFLFGESRTAYSDFCIKNALSSGGNIYIMQSGEKAAGYICTAAEEDRIVVLYAMTLPGERKRGIFTSLLKHVIDLSPKEIKLSISENAPYYASVKAVCERSGFTENSSCIVFSGNTEDFCNWEAYMKKTGNKFCDILSGQGFRCVSFLQADSDLLEKLYDSGNNSFENKLDIKPFFDNGEKCLSKDMSFMAVKENEIAAYTMVSCPDKASTVFEHISTAEKYIRSGVIMLPFAASMGMFKKNNCKRAAYAMYESNHHANSFRKKLLEKVTSSQKRSHNFIYRKGEIHYE